MCSDHHDFRTCQIDDCEHCQANVDDGIVMACDECDSPGHADANGWVMGVNGLVYCAQCAHTLAVEAA